MRRRDLMLLTGTPLSQPGDGYAYVKLISPEVYRSQQHFEQLHVGQRDFFDNVVRWENLEFLAENLLLNSMRVYQRDALPFLEEPQYLPIVYELDPAHKALYNQLANELLIETEAGGKIDATVKARLYTYTQQIVVNPGHFSGDPNMRSAAHELIDTVLAEINCADPVDGSKIIIFANYRMTNRGLLEYLAPYGAVGCYSEVSQAHQQRNLERFIEDPKCRIMCAHPLSAGYGLDGLEMVCADALFIEEPIVPKDFNQAVGRLVRGKQTRTPRIRIAIAEGTIQVRLHRQLLEKDALVNSVQGGWKDLKDAIYGR